MNNIATFPSRIAGEEVQDAVIDLTFWASLTYTDCPGCGTSVAARDQMAATDEWWRFIFKVRRWLERPGSEALAGSRGGC
jgi:hypothetical protein